ncbi:MAG: hypothetical protein AB7Q16_25115 [Vicinamibacterales bacterium]
MTGIVVSVSLAWAVASGVLLAAQAPVEKVPIVAVAGCLAQQDDRWLLTSATDPEPSIANAPPAGQPYKGPTSGKNTFHLIGVSEFDLPSLKGHTVLVKALFIKAEPVSRLNITSVTMIAETCPPK